MRPNIHELAMNLFQYLYGIQDFLETHPKFLQLLLWPGEGYEQEAPLPFESIFYYHIPVEMISAIRQFFEKHIQVSPDSSERRSEDTLRLATAALLIEMMRADAEISEEEKTSITKIIRNKSGLSENEMADLIKLAEEEISRATGYFEFTSLINKGFSYEEKVHVIENLWEVAFADTTLDKYEEHMVRKIAGLLYVSHKDFINAKLRVKKKLGVRS